MNTKITTRLPLEGHNFTLGIHFESGPGAFGEGQQVYLVLEQKGTVYAMGRGDTYVSTVWKALKFNGSLLSSAFTRISGTGPANPDLASGVPTRFGLGGENNDANVLTNYYDGAVANCVEIRFSVISDWVRISDQAARSMH